MIWAALGVPILHAAADDPAILQIRIAEGEGLTYTAGSRATRGITVQVTDETGRPVESAAVTFRLPEDGPSGVFANASRTELSATNADGRASAWGMQWNRTAGAFEVRITASKGSARAGTICSLYLTEGAAEGAGAPKQSRRGGIPKWLWISAVIAGGAGAGIAAASHGSSQAPTTAAAVVGAPHIGTPTIIIGHP